MSLLVHWLVLLFHDPQVADLNPVGDSQGYDLFREIATINLQFLQNQCFVFFYKNTEYFLVAQSLQYIKYYHNKIFYAVYFVQLTLIG